jgi:hypothetical protein
MAAGDTDAMAAAITDEMLDEYAVTATWDGLAAALNDRYRGRADRIFGYGPVRDWIDSPEISERWQAVAAVVQAASMWGPAGSATPS